MDNDRVEGSAKNIKGQIKEKAGELLGDTKMQTDGKADQAEGKVQNTWGSAKDKLRDATR